MDGFEKIIILGTGNAQALNCYNTCFALKNRNEYLLVDAGGGNGILKMLEEKSIGLENIHHAILTHSHTDHILGMIWIFRMVAASMKKGDYNGTFTVYCHDVAKDALLTILKLTIPRKFTDLIGEKIFIREIHDGETLEIMGCDITFFDILSTKAKQYGFLFETGHGRFVCLGDEPCNELNQKLIYDAYIVMHEAFCLYEDRDIFKPYEKHHSTAKDAAIIADQCNVKNLILYHTEDKDLKSRKQKYREEASLYFKGKIYVPDDGEEIDIS